MSDIINLKDFYNHETRLSIVENAIISIDKRFEQVDKQFDKVDKRFEQVDKRFDTLEHKFETKFNLLIGLIGGLYLTVIGSLVTVIIKMH